MLVDRDQDRNPRWVGPLRPELFSMGQQALAWAHVWKSGRNHLKFRTPCRRKSDLVDNLRFGTQLLDQVQKTSQWNHHGSCTVSRHSAGSPTTTSVTPLSLLPAPKQKGNTRATCRGVVNQAIADPAVCKLMSGKYMLEVFGGSGFVAKATNHLG